MIRIMVGQSEGLQGNRGEKKLNYKQERDDGQYVLQKTELHVILEKHFNMNEFLRTVSPACEWKSITLKMKMKSEQSTAKWSEYIAQYPG